MNTPRRSILSLQSGTWPSLGIVSCIENPSFDFEEKSVTISGSRGQTVKYHYADAKLVKDCRPTKEFNMPDEGKSPLQDALTEVLRASSVLGLADLCIQPNGDKIQLTWHWAKRIQPATHTLLIWSVLPMIESWFQVLSQVGEFEVASGWLQCWCCCRCRCWI